MSDHATLRTRLWQWLFAPARWLINWRTAHQAAERARADAEWAQYECEWEAFERDDGPMPTPPPGHEVYSPWPKHRLSARDQLGSATFVCELSDEGIAAVEQARVLGARVCLHHLAHRWKAVCSKGCRDADPCPWHELVREVDLLESILVYQGATFRLVGGVQQPMNPTLIGTEADLTDKHGYTPGVYHLNPKLTPREALRAVSEPTGADAIPPGGHTHLAHPDRRNPQPLPGSPEHPPRANHAQHRAEHGDCQRQPLNPIHHAP